MPLQNNSTKFKKGTWIVKLKRLQECDQCKIYFENSMALRSHIHENEQKSNRSSLLLKSNRISIQQEEIILKCEECNKTFQSKLGLSNRNESIH